MSAREQLKIAGQFNKELACLCGQTVTAKLRRRLKDFEQGSTSARHDKQTDRWEQGGYHRPGSLKK